MGTLQGGNLNPNPITKFFVVILCGFTLLNSIHPYLEWLLIFFISAMFFMNGFKKEAVKSVLVFGVLFFLPSFQGLAKVPLAIKLFVSLLIVMRMFYLPYITGKFLIKTSDVGSLISSMDCLKIPNVISIPIAVMFRFFPSFVEERNNIRMAMKIRGIDTKNPIKYLKYIAVPLLIISSNIGDDISKAAETKCIANPIKKTRYIRIGIKAIDFIYAGIVTSIVLGGLLCL